MALRVAGLIFLFVAIMHLLRLLYKVDVFVGGTSVRLSVSLVGFVIALFLAMWMFAASKK